MANRYPLLAIAEYVQDRSKFNVTQEISEISEEPCNKGSSVFSAKWTCGIQEAYSEHDVVVKFFHGKFASVSKEGEKISHEKEPEIDEDLFCRAMECEFQAWRKITPHENVLPLIGFYSGQQGKGLVSPRVDHPNFGLWWQEQESEGQMMYDRRCQIILDLAKGLKHLHDQYLIHGDLHLGNVFVHNEIVIIGDFAVSRMAETMTSLFRTSNPYRELKSFTCASFLKDEAMYRTLATDIYMFGMTAQLIFMGKDPKEKVTACGYAKVVKLLNRCRDEKPKSRPTAAKVLSSISKNSTGDHVASGEGFIARHIHKLLMRF